MPELGKYAATVLGAYGAALGLLVALVVASLWRGRRVRADLARSAAAGERAALVDLVGALGE